jgi:GntR family transcriptional regulator / MocR family aminotransferase
MAIHMIAAYIGPFKEPDMAFPLDPEENMPKQPTLLLQLEREKGPSLHSQLAMGLKMLVQTGVLRPGKPVPSSRELARDLRISRNTVIQAFDRLIGEGYLESSPRRGLFVSSALPEQISRRRAPPVRRATAEGIPAQSGAEQFRAPTPFCPCQPDVRLFPLKMWNRLRARSLRRYGSDLLHYQSQLTLGAPALRRSLATYLRESRGVRCDWQQIAVTGGSQEALHLLAQVILRPGRRVIMEDPGYLGARRAWERAGARLIPAQIDAEGMRLPDVNGAPPHLVYSTPSRQFPTGACLSLARRIALVDYAARLKAWVVEDDYDSEYRYARPPLASLQSLDSSQRVIYVGSMSKVLFPSLRIGYAVLPESLVEPVAAARSVLDDHGPLIDQVTLAEFIESGAFYTHIRRSRNEYARRLDAFVETARELDLRLTFPHTDGGMNVAGFLDTATQESTYALALSRLGMDIPPLSHYSLKRTRPGLVFGFTAFEPDVIRDALKSVAKALRHAAAIA